MASRPAGGKNLASNRIKQLNEIDADVVRLLEAAGSAVKELTIASDKNDHPTDSEPNPGERRAAFTAATTRYFTLLSSIDVGLRRQIVALEESGVVPAENTARESQVSNDATTANAFPSSQSSRHVAGRGVTTGGGLGSLDVGWLNSRNDKVGKEKEASLWEEAERFAHKLLLQKNGRDQRTNNISEHRQDSTGDTAMDGG